MRIVVCVGKVGSTRNTFLLVPTESIENLLLPATNGTRFSWNRIGLRSLSGEPESYRFVVDNSTVPEIAKSKYWSETEPRKPPPDEKLALCVAIDNRGSVKNWETYPCHLSKQYICEFEESAVLTSARSSCTVTGYSEDGNENNSRSVKPFPTSSGALLS